MYGYARYRQEGLGYHGKLIVSQMWRIHRISTNSRHNNPSIWVNRADSKVQQLKEDKIVDLMAYSH